VTHTLIPLTERERWTAALQYVPHSFGHTWESCYAMSLTTGLDTYLYHYEDNGGHIVCPISERNFQGHVDIFTPYGFSGFVGNQKMDEFPSVWKNFAEEKKYVCGYIMMNPFLRSSSDNFKTNSISKNDLYALNLKMSLEQLFSNMSTNRKRQVKKHHEILSTFTQEKSLLKPFFLDNFHKFFKDKNAGLFSGFTEDTLTYLVDLDNVILLGKILDGKVVAVSVFAYTKDIAEYLFNISDQNGKAQTVPLLWEGMRVLKELGIPLLNLGGGLKRGDSLSEFKERFGAEKFPQTVLKQVYNKKIFQQLCDTTGVSDQDDYFPPYRKKIITNPL